MDYLYPLIALVFLLILFHTVFIKFFPQNKRFWKKVDYWWVSLGVIAIIGASFSYSKEISSAWTPLHKRSLTAVYNQYQDGVRRLSIEFSDTTGYLQSIAESPIQKRKFNNAGVIFSLLSKQVDSCKGFILNEEQYNLIDQVTNNYMAFIATIDDKFITNICSSTTFMAERSREEANTLINLRQKGDRDELNWILLIISPYLFSIAIAIRLTKVTAELKDIK